MLKSRKLTTFYQSAIYNPFRILFIILLRSLWSKTISVLFEKNKDCFIQFFWQIHKHSIEYKNET